MALIVQKYGGSSLGQLERIRFVADKIIKAQASGHHLVVVVSAMYGETDRLIRLANALTQEPNPREYDVLISTGEQVSMALLSMALNARGCEARSFTGPQIGIHTDGIYNKARILRVDTQLITRELTLGRVVVVAGFQGVNESGDVTTLGRGGSDTTAVAIAAALKANECQIYTDVDGVYTTDPHLIPEARLLPQVSFEEMLEMSSLGAKVLQLRSVELASKYQMPIRVLSTFSEGPGTLVTFKDNRMMQKQLVSGIAFSREEAMITLGQIPRRMGMESMILEEISLANIEIDMMTQQVTQPDYFDFTFTISRRDQTVLLQLMQSLARKTGSFSIQSNLKVAKLSLVGIGIRSHAGVMNALFKTLNKIGVEAQMVTTSEIKVSLIVDEIHLEKSVKALHHTFQLDKTPSSRTEIYIE